MELPRSLAEGIVREQKYERLVTPLTKAFLYENL